MMMLAMGVRRALGCEKAASFAHYTRRGNTRYPVAHHTGLGLAVAAATFRLEGAHSPRWPKRNRSKYHNALSPSCQLICFPSAYCPAEVADFGLVHAPAPVSE